MQSDLVLKISDSDINISNQFSFCNNLWKLKDINYDYVDNVSKCHGLSYITSILLNNRNIPIDLINKFINPKLKDLMPNPFVLSDMDKAVTRIIQAINNKEYICIFGDYDVDGATSSALLYKFLVMIGYDENKIMIHIPDRLSEGYGLNTDFIENLYSKQKYSLIITVDCGITSLKEVDFANKHGFDVIIIDHHQPLSELPNAIAVINPKKINEKVDYSYMAAVGVCFFVICALHRELKYNKYYQNNYFEEPNLLSLLDLVALGTVCDVVPVIGINRAFINTGIKILSNRANIGLNSLCDVSEINSKITTYHLGFVLGPRINAGGRIGDSSIGVKLSCSKNPIIAKCYAEQLNEYNLKRREMESIYLREAFNKIDIEYCKKNNLIFLSEKNWHSGIIGIISGKVKEEYNLPTFIASIDESTNIAKGSARSVTNINIGNIISKAKDCGIIIQGGGHNMAAGFTYYVDREKDLINFLQIEIQKELQNRPIVNTLSIDAIIDISAVNLDFAKDVHKLSPYGEKNPEPIFLITSARLLKVNVINNLHISCIFANTNNYYVNTISFKALNTNMGQILLKNIGKSFNIVGKIRINNYNGSDSVSFLLEDANFSS